MISDNPINDAIDHGYYMSRPDVEETPHQCDNCNDMFLEGYLLDNNDKFCKECGEDDEVVIRFYAYCIPDDFSSKVKGLMIQNILDRREVI
jgi:hypothetical protein